MLRIKKKITYFEHKALPSQSQGQAPLHSLDSSIIKNFN